MADAKSQTHDPPPNKNSSTQSGDRSLPDLTGRTLGDYHILRRLGVGGMGQVYLARQLSLKREVALKLLRDDLNKNQTALMRFQAEAEAVAKLNHPNIVHIHQMGEAEGLRFMALEYVEGRNLRDHLARKGPPDLPVTLSIIRQVVLAIQQAHDQGIVHRDIKPENILVTRKVEVKVTDFGLSRYFAGETPALNLTQSGVTLGTPLYMSPEQVQGHAVDQRSDIYSLGVTCYHLIAGEPPFRGATAFDVALKHVQEEPQPLSSLRPDVPEELCAMVHKMMAKSPKNRYASGREILRELSRLRDGLAGSAPSGANLQVSAIALSGLIPTYTSPTLHNGLQNTDELPATSAPPRWRNWAILGSVCLLAGIGGVLLASSKGTHPEPVASIATNPNPTSSEPGLLDIHMPEKAASTRERELLAAIAPANRTGKPEDAFQCAIELGLLYVHERKLDKAMEVFRNLEQYKILEKEQLAGLPSINRAVSMAGRLGQAIALAYRDMKPSAIASNELVVKVLNDPFPNAKQKVEKTYQAVSAFLVKHPDLNQALAEALNRNMGVLGLTKLEPPLLELLRLPPRLGLHP